MSTLDQQTSKKKSRGAPPVVGFMNAGLIGGHGPLLTMTIP